MATYNIYLQLDDKQLELPIEDNYNENLVIPPRCKIMRQVKLANIKEDSDILSKQIKPGVFCANTLVSPEAQYVKFINVNSNANVIPHDFVPQIIPAKNFTTQCVNKEHVNDDSRIKRLLNEINLKSVPSEIKEKLSTLCEKYNDIFALSGEPLSTNNFYRQTIY